MSTRRAVVEKLLAETRIALALGAGHAVVIGDKATTRHLPKLLAEAIQDDFDAVTVPLAGSRETVADCLAEAIRNARIARPDPEEDAAPARKPLALMLPHALSIPTAALRSLHEIATLLGSHRLVLFIDRDATPFADPAEELSERIGISFPKVEIEEAKLRIEEPEKAPAAAPPVETEPKPTVTRKAEAKGKAKSKARPAKQARKRKPAAQEKAKQPKQEAKQPKRKVQPPKQTVEAETPPNALAEQEPEIALPATPPVATDVGSLDLEPGPEGETLELQDDPLELTDGLPRFAEPIVIDRPRPVARNPRPKPERRPVRIWRWAALTAVIAACLVAPDIIQHLPRPGTPSNDGEPTQTAASDTPVPVPEPQPEARTEVEIPEPEIEKPIEVPVPPKLAKPAPSQVVAKPEPKPEPKPTRVAAAPKKSSAPAARPAPPRRSAKPAKKRTVPTPPPAVRPPAPRPAPKKKALLAPATGPIVRVNFNAAPWAELTVDDRKLGPTPIGNVRLASGEHRVRAKFPNGRVVERDIHVDATRTRFQIR